MVTSKNISKNNKIIIGVIVGVLICFVSFFSLLALNTSAVSKESDEQVFEVVQGDNLNSILLRLEDEKFIKNRTFSKISAKLSGIDGFVAGQFKINRNWNSNTILEYFTKQQNVMRDEVMITFREGIWAKDIAYLIEKNIGINANDLIAFWNDETFLNTCINKYEFLDNSILNNNYRVKLEGYFYPETYCFSKKATKEEITYTFLNHFDSVYQELKKDIKKSKYSIHELITLASVVQYESKSVEDMNNISGVFYNRLNMNMPLQSSVTVCYAMYEYDSWEECEIYTDIDSLYNTYKHTGLPIGPILNPGMDAIKAVISPNKHDYVYFIADINNIKGEGTGKVYYSKTFDEHLKLQNELGLSW